MSPISDKHKKSETSHSLCVVLTGLLRTYSCFAESLVVGSDWSKINFVLENLRNFTINLKIQ